MVDSLFLLSCVIYSVYPQMEFFDQDINASIHFIFFVWMFLEGKIWQGKQENNRQDRIICYM